jgi:ABC-2 type transport system ATP-binding protein
MEVNQQYSIVSKALTAGNGKAGSFADLSLSVPRNTVFALVGAEGAGKSAFLRVLVNLLRPDSGSAAISGVPCNTLRAKHFTRIGYVPQSPSMPGWMEAGEYLRYCRGFYSNWDDAFCENLTQAFHLKLNAKLRQANPETRAKLALVAALSFRPSVLLLDEPFSRVDRRERDAMIRAVMELIDLDDWSILITGRETDEVERMADWIGLLHQGRLEFAESMASLQRRFRQVEAFAMEPETPAGGFPETWIDLRFEGHRLRFTDTRFDGRETPSRVRAMLGENCTIETKPVSARDIFDALDRTYGLSSESS